MCFYSHCLDLQWTNALQSVYPPLELGARTWTVNGLILAGLSYPEDTAVTYVRDESINLWNYLNNLQKCPDAKCSSPVNCNTTRGVWISGPPGVGKSTEVFGWVMYMVTRTDGCARNVLWVHQMQGFHIRVVRIIHGVITFKNLEDLSGGALVGAIKSLCSGCSLLIFDAVRDEMKALVGGLFLDNRDAIIIACTSYQSGDYNTEESTRMHHFNLRCVVYSWTWEEYLAAHAEGIFGDITIPQLEERFYISGGCIRLMLKDNATAQADLDQFRG